MSIDESNVSNEISEKTNRSAINARHVLCDNFLRSRGLYFES